MRSFRHIVATAAVGAVLTAVGSAAAADQQTSDQTDAAAPAGDQSAPYGGAPLTGDQLSQTYQKLSPEARAALSKQLQSKGLDSLSNMSESDARTAFGGLPADVRAQIQTKWDALSDEQRIALKKMGPDAIKGLVAAQMKEMMKQSVSPVAKPVAQIVEKAQSVADKAQTLMQRGRDYVQGLIAKLKGESAEPQSASSGG